MRVRTRKTRSKRRVIFLRRTQEVAGPPTYRPLVMLHGGIGTLTMIVSWLDSSHGFRLCSTLPFCPQDSSTRVVTVGAHYTYVSDAHVVPWKLVRNNACGHSTRWAETGTSFGPATLLVACQDLSPLFFLCCGGLGSSKKKQRMRSLTMSFATNHSSALMHACRVARSSGCFRMGITAAAFWTGQAPLIVSRRYARSHSPGK